MADADVGWVVGEGRMLSTRDGGLSWQVQELPDGLRDASLRGVHSIDANQAVAVGLEGVRLRTRDAGRLWEDRSRAMTPGDGGVASRRPLPEGSTQADLRAVFCFEAPEAVCVSLGASGGTAYSVDLGESWLAASRSPGVDVQAIAMPDGTAEISDDARGRLAGLSRLLAKEPRVSIRIEPVASAAEIERIGRQRDPEALFEILEARVLDVQSILEEAGVGSDRIQVRGTPPWGFEDVLDDDPEFLERYWRSRRNAEAGVQLVPIDEGTMLAGLFSAGLGAGTGAPGSVDEAGSRPGRPGQLVAVGGAGRVWHSSDRGRSWTVETRVAGGDWLSIAEDSGDLIAIGAAPGSWMSRDGGRGWEPYAGLGALELSASLTDLDFSREAGLGLVVGKGGVVVRRAGAAGPWTRVLPAVLD